MAAKKKGKPASPESPDDRVAIIHLKGTRAFAEWLDDAYRKTHIAKATIVRLALADWGEKNGVGKPPEF